MRRAAPTRRVPGGRGPPTVAAAVTSVPCGAPAAASSRARSFVESGLAQVQPRAAERHGSMQDLVVEPEVQELRAEPRLIASASVR